MGHCPLVVLKDAPGLQLEKKVAPLGVDEKGRIAFGQQHQKIEAAATTTRLSTIETTMTQMTTRVNFLLFMVVIWLGIRRQR